MTSKSLAGLLKDRSALIVGDDEIAAGVASAFELADAQVTTFKHRILTSPGSTADALLREAFAAHRGTLDILAVFPAAPPPPARLEDLALSGIEEQVMNDVRETATWIQAALPSMQNNGGRILIGGSRYGPNVDRYLAGYSAAMGALHGLVRACAAEWGRFQITCNMLVPVAATAEYRVYQSRFAQEAAELLEQLPLHRVGDPVFDIGGAAIFLASEDSRFVTGQIIYADGGQSLTGALLEPTPQRLQSG